MTTAFASEYAERKLGVEQSERDARMDIPIFVCTLAFPFMPTILHVFEPRYVPFGFWNLDLLFSIHARVSAPSHVLD